MLYVVFHGEAGIRVEGRDLDLTLSMAPVAGDAESLILGHEASQPAADTNSGALGCLVQALEPTMSRLTWVRAYITHLREMFRN